MEYASSLPLRTLGRFSIPAANVLRSWPREVRVDLPHESKTEHPQRGHAPLQDAAHALDPFPVRRPPGHDLLAECRAHLIVGDARVSGHRANQSFLEHLTTAATMYREMGMTYWLDLYHLSSLLAESSRGVAAT